MGNPEPSLRDLSPEELELLHRRLAEKRKGSSPPTAKNPIRRRRDDLPLQLSAGQRRIWLMGQMDPSGHAFNVAAGLRLRGPLALDALRGALQRVVARHEALRLRFRDSGSVPAMVVQDAEAVALPVEDLSSEAEPER
ncbi:MAG: condensation domain-containing protein, partial [Acidobacteriota bacterium]|nr:condensation domain-containing protein [Acidobacteriota bacterium]